MRILVRHAPPLRRWHLNLAESLRAEGHAVAFEAVPVPFSLRRDYRILRALERLFLGASCDLYAVAPASGPSAAEVGGADLVVVLAGGLSGAPTVVQPLFDATAGERALLDALLRGVAPLVTVRGRFGGGGRLLAAGRPTLGDPQVLSRSLGDVLPLLVDLLVQAIARHDTGAGPAADATAPSDTIQEPARRAFVATVARRTARRLRLA